MTRFDDGSAGRGASGAVAARSRAPTATKTRDGDERDRRCARAAADAQTEPDLPQVPGRGLYTEAARLQRLEWLGAETGAALAPLRATRLAAERLTGNVENLIGAVEVPVGLAGPLRFRGDRAQGVIYAPLATTEGALVASASRGATAISRSGGVATRVVRQRMTRVPMFALATLRGAFVFAEWVRAHVEELAAQTRLVSRHARLVAVEPVIMGNKVHLHLGYETGDAAGQNMTTACAWQACQWIEGEVAGLEEIELQHFLVDANMSGDKKVSFQALSAGRGMRVIAECMLSRRVLEDVLKVTPEQVVRANAAGMSAGAHIGMVGYNINVANVIAGVFTATGQDIACVHESGIGQLHVEVVADGLYASLLLPGLIVGTVGGGTHLPAQRVLLEMMGCAGDGGARRLAEIIAGYCLALDLSTLAAASSGEFARAHERLGRNRPVDWLKREELDARFFEPGLRRALDRPALTVDAVEPAELGVGSSITSELAGRKATRLIGLVPLRLRHRDGAGAAVHTDVVVKVKPLDEEIILATDSMAALLGGRLAAAHHRFRHRTGFAKCHLRELAVYEQTDPRFTRHAPRVYGTHIDVAREAYVVVLERLAGLRHVDSVDDVSGWTTGDVEAALRGIAEVHSVWLGREADLTAQPWLGPVPSASGMAEMVELWDALATHAAAEFPRLVTPDRLRLQRRMIHALPDWWARLEAMPRTLIHNDFNPRNIALRADPGARGGLRLCAYDWELATLHVPQHDLAELLCFVLGADTERREVDHLVEVHRRALEEASGISLDPRAWREGYALSLCDLAINRLALYLAAHTFRHYGFLERTVGTLWRLLALERDVSRTIRASGCFPAMEGT